MNIRNTRYDDDCENYIYPGYSNSAWAYCKHCERRIDPSSDGWEDSLCDYCYAALIEEEEEEEE